MNLPLKRGGFTLIEMLVALAIFAVIGLLSVQLLNRIVDHYAILSERGARLIEVQRAMHILKRDVMQYQPERGIRSEYDDFKAALEIDDDVLEFTRSGWRNPLQQPRASVQRVAYALDDNNLQRYYWNVLDRAQDSLPLEQTLLTEVESIEFLALDEVGNSHSFLPLPAGTPPNIKAILMRIEFAPYGFVERIWEIPSS